ncbi:HAD-IA family hydrolase [Labedella endophytica]|uniref:HAD family hydrolase n=1 Tax=Labedella endophytica TaxID=1523160 RepID=A0A433JPC2_9MICO|nr:HAD-IA family hydrolase [Labedella endophytica]RUQ98257.1 HAD family hydrolase [Labedella endophytica]
MSHRVLCRPSALLFDCDGVLVDSLASAEAAWKTWATTYKPDFDMERDMQHGRRAMDTIAELVAPDVVERAFEDLLRSEMETVDGTGAIPGAVALTDSLPVGRWVAVTSGPRELALARLNSAGITLPERLVTAEDVDRGKPDPQPYLRGAEHAGVPVAECVVFEDAPAGIAAGRAAGVGWVVGIGAGALEPWSDGSRPDVVVPDLDAVRFVDGDLVILSTLS